MRKLVAGLVGVSLISTPAVSQVRPQDCLPVLPVVDQVAAVPQDVIAQPAAPVATAATRRFFGLPFLLPLLAGLGGLAALGGGGGGGGDDPDVVSPD
jgi:hypothetical protein